MDNGELFVYVLPRLTEKNTRIGKRMTLPTTDSTIFGEILNFNNGFT